MPSPLAAIALIAAALGAGAPALAKTDRAQVWSAYFAELGRQCPDKRLDLLSPADLDLSLQAFKAAQTAGVRSRMDRASQARCETVVAGVTCSNTGVIEAAERLRLTRPLAAKVCADHRLCRAQSDCD